MAHKLTIEPQSVQETMLIPLWGRAKYSQLYPELLDDPKADKIIEKIAYDFSKFEKEFKEYGGLCYLVRARNFDNAIREYIQKYPEATVVNLGAGLDTTFSRIDNGKIKWYDLDLSDAIAFRKKLIPETSRSECIAKSVFDTSWFDDVEYKEEKGIYFLAGGLFQYFKESEISELVSNIAERFPNGEMIFDAVSKRSLWLGNRMIKKAGNKGAQMYFGLDNPVKQISKYSDNIEVTEWYPYWHGIKRDSRWGKSTIFMINFCDWFKMAKFVRIRFLFSKGIVK